MAIGGVGARTKRVDSDIEAVKQDGRGMKEGRKSKQRRYVVVYVFLVSMLQAWGLTRDIYKVRRSRHSVLRGIPYRGQSHSSL